MLLMLMSAGEIVSGHIEKMLARAPVMQLESAAPAPALAQCIGLALDPLGKPVLTRGDGRTYITIGKPEQSLVLITIYEEAPTKIEVRQAFPFNSKWRNRIRFCADAGGEGSAREPADRPDH